jgi:hypothetical protein
MVSLWKLMGAPVDLPARGSFPVQDSFGLRVAVAMLAKSLEPGRYDKTHQQFEMIRKLRAAYSNKTSMIILSVSIFYYQEPH